MRGWILDLYTESPGKMVVWLKLEGGETRRLVDRWAPSIFAASDNKRDLADLEKGRGRDFSWSRRVMKLERATDRGESEVLELVVDDAKKLAPLAESVERSRPFGAYRLYNVDVPPEQMYLYENDLFPLAYCEVSETPDGLSWDIQDDIWACQYEVPTLRSVSIDVVIKKSGKMAKVSDPIESISLKGGDGSVSIIDGGSEESNILGLVEEVAKLDPDLVFTNDGDAFVLPYLVSRAAANGVADRLRIDRDGNVLEAPAKKGTSYFSYGKILFKPSAMRFSGRIHLDTTSSFVNRECGLEGFFEVSRVCRLPLHTASRASIGKALSSLQFYYATKDGILIPWKPVMAEHFKSRAELLIADRGGFIFEPELGVHEGVGELDFSSLFPSIMSKKNISPETVRCACCPDSKNRIPELGWNVCERRPQGIVPKAVKIIVEKRMKYKRLEQVTQGEERARYESRRSALKWVGVACLPKESPVFIRSNDGDRFARIGDFIDSIVGDKVGVIECPPGVFVAGVGHDYKAKYCKVARLIKKPNNQKLLSFVMEDGRKIITTPDHRFFTLRGGDLEIRTAEEMQVGELVPVARKIPPAKEIHYVNVIEQLTGLLSPREQQLWRVSGEQLKEVIKTKRRTLIGMAISEGYSYQSVISWIKSGIIPLRFFKMLDVAPEIHPALRIGSGRRKGGRVAWLPAVLEVDGRLGFFLGLFVADGSAKNNAVRLDIALSEPELLETTRKLVESIFKISPRVYKEKSAQMHVVQINSASLVRVLEKVFGLPGSADRGKLKVPDIIFNCPAQAAHRFMAGLVAGDGNAAKRRKFVSIATASKNLQNQISVLAARLGLAFRMKADHREGTQPLYTVNFVGPETLGIIGNWEYSKEGKRDKIRSWSEEYRTGTCTHIRYERLPIDESGLFTLAKSTRTSSEPHARAGSRLCPIQVKKKITRIHSRKLNENQAAQTMKIEKLLDSDLGFVRIKRAERLSECPEFVYCFQLEDDEVPGFFAGEGLTYTRNCFGYLGFNNAKFGRIDAHIGVCAWDRKVLVDAARVAERRGFRVMHGIVDSLWLKKSGATTGDFEKLRREIEAETKFAISFEGIYRWIAFLPSKVNAGVPVLNQYFGAYQDGKLKVRGIEARRHDTPAFFSKCQLEILELLAGAGTVEEARVMVGDCIKIFLRHARSLLEHRAPIGGLVFTRNLSKKPGEYANRSLTSIVGDQMVREGVELHAGESVQYVITDYESKSPGKRALAFELVDEKTVYDAKRYVELLAETCSTVLTPFRRDCSAEALVQIVEREILHVEALS
jgi:DNA polymerase elongation subunit (family B)